MMNQIIDTRIPPPLSCSPKEYNDLISLASSIESFSDAETELLECSRYGEMDSVRALLEVWSNRIPDFVNTRNPTGSTALHFACANGHLSTVHLLLSAGALHVKNQSGGNTPLHWAAQNSHAAVIQLLLNHAPFRFQTRPNQADEGIDVLEKNDAGRSALTEGFGSRSSNPSTESVIKDLNADDDAHIKMIGILLEHDSATEDRLIGGESTSTDKEDTTDVPMEEEVADSESSTMDNERTSSLSSSVATNSSGVIHEFNFWLHEQDSPNSTVLIRELPIQNADSPFGTTAAEDTTGLGIWCASLVSARWLLHLTTQGRFDDKVILELGAGCGVPGLTVASFSRAKLVYLTDFNAVTMKNLQYNLDLNSKTVCDNTTLSNLCWYDRVTALKMDWADPSTWPTTGHVDCILGSDLIYQKSIVPLLKKVVDGLLKSGGTFFYVCPSDGRDGLNEFIMEMKDNRFTCVYESVAPNEYRDNPLANKDEEEAFLHFYELPVTEFLLLEFRKQ